MKALGGIAPFDDLPPISQRVKIIQGERPPRSVDKTLTDDVWTLVRMCWDQEPRSRPKMGRVLRDLAPSLLQSLHKFTKSSPEFQVALNQFGDSTKLRCCLSLVHIAELKEFVTLLDDVRQTFCFPHLHPIVTSYSGATD